MLFLTSKPPKTASGVNAIRISNIYFLVQRSVLNSNAVK